MPTSSPLPLIAAGIVTDRFDVDSTGLILTLLAPVAAVAASFPSGDVPGWVEPLEVDLSVPEPTGPVRRGTQYLLIDHQMRIGSDGAVALYSHLAYRIVTPQALDDRARLELDYTPFSEHLTVHRLEVWRDGAWHDRLTRSESVEIDGEDDLWKHILSGTSTLVIVPEDIRVGDIIRYAWTVEDENPLFGGHAARSWQMAWSIPAERRSLRVLRPEATPLQVALHGDATAPDERALGAEVELRWDAGPVPAIPAVDDAPIGHEVWPWVQLSTFPDWASVVDWALDHYELTGPPSAEVAAVAAGLAPADATDAAVFTAALRWVQDEVRYFGVELGVGSYQPRPPDLVLRRRYGDCKDKTLLLVALLRARGVQAWPALVNSSDRGAISTWLPSPTAFDHVIVAAEIDGRLVFADPTRVQQGGPVARIFVGDYGKALLVRPGESGLVDVDQVPDSIGRLETRSRYTFSDDHLGIGLQVDTCSYGRRAEIFRAALSDQTPEQMQDAYSAYYRRAGTTVSIVEPIGVTDHRDANRLCISERYDLDDAWSEGEGQRRFDTFAPPLLQALPAVDDPDRAAPLALPLGRHEIEEVVIAAPRRWTLEPRTASVANEWFRYRLEATPSKWDSSGTHEIALRHTLEVVADQVPAAGLARYEQDRERIGDELAYQLQRGAPSDPVDHSGLVTFIAVVFVLAAAALPTVLPSAAVLMFLVWLVRRRPKAGPERR
ncbi:MAG: DUF3857 domain-containing protein [Alphaproteobacteria bacterium]|nr:DUF3857 domain-containing protein [Alphaproteobacteria bacterium]